jgi:predicted polyphosphate/ATP-dependent NAD kinase
LSGSPASDPNASRTEDRVQGAREVRPGGAGAVTGPIGIACNPASGKDVRRLVARASVFDNQEKQAIVRRAVVGAIAAGAREFRYVPDTHDLAQNALAEFASEIDAKAVDAPRTASALDTTRGAASLRDAGCAVVITLGGDGTNRAFARGWRDAPLLPISTGTNNVFPRVGEATIAGMAAAFVATGRIALADAGRRAKAITIAVDGEKDDLALIDAVLTQDRFVGARALLDSDRISLVLLTRADPSAVGMTSIGGLVAPLGEEEDEALLLALGGAGASVRAPIAPGLFQDVVLRKLRRVAFDEPVTVIGPGTLAFDGERERVLLAGSRAILRVARDGPFVVDVSRVMAQAAAEGWLVTGDRTSFLRASPPPPRASVASRAAKSE